MAPKIVALNIYPIKSCGGISITEAEIWPTGLAFDRQWMVVNSKGRMLTQRVEPRLALVNLSLPTHVMKCDWGSPFPDAALAVRAPGMEPLFVCLTASQWHRRVEASVWEWSGWALDEGPDAAEWFSRYLGRPGCRLVRFQSGVEKRQVPNPSLPNYQTAFSDQYPFMILSKASLDALNGMMSLPVPMNRFRPNIVVDGCEPFEEDTWRDFTIEACSQEGSTLSFQAARPCSRCKIITTDQATGEINNEAMNVLREFRSGSTLGMQSNFSSKVFFGMHLVCRTRLEMSGEPLSLAIGQSLRVRERSDISILA